MATELLDKRFTGAAAVMAGSVLEEHLRKLATKRAIAIRDNKDRPKSVEILGIELRNDGAFSEVQRKSVVAWYALRTEAAHGRIESLPEAEVERMVDAVRDFIGRHPA